MKTIEQIRELREQGSKKWGRDLYLHVLPRIEQNQTREEISCWLAKEHGMAITADRIKHLVNYYRRKLDKLSQPAASFPLTALSSSGSIAQKQENTKPPPSYPGQFQPAGKLVLDEDFRTPTPKPKSVRE